MKQIKTIIAAFAVAAVALSCTKELTVTEIQNETETVSIGFSADAIGSKAVFGEKDGNNYPVFWSANDVAPAITVNYNDSFVQATDFSRSSDGRTANFKGEFAGLTGEQVFIAVTPYSCLKSIYMSAKRLNVEIPSGQTNGNGSPDEAAIIGYAVSDTYTSTPEKVSLSFQHITAYLHLTFTNLSLASGEQVQSVDITSDKEISGRMFFYPETKTTSSNSMVKVISVATSQVADVWAGIAPVDLSDETVSFKVVTDQGTYSKDVTLGAGKVLTCGKAAKLTVDMTGVARAAFETYTLVTDASALHVNDEILIVGAKEDFALSTAQNANNRGAASVVIDGNNVIAPSDAVQRITLKDGFVPGEYALYTGSQYLYFASGGNYLRSQDSVDASASWDIDIVNSTDENHGTGYVAYIQEKIDERFIRHNVGSALFSAYVSSSSTSFVRIYRKDQDVDTTPRFNVTLPGGNSASASAQTVSVYVFGNVAWTASVSGGASLDKTSGTGNDILTLSIPENTDTSNPKNYVVTVSTTASAPTTVFNLTLTQAKAVSSGIPVGSVLFYETWVGGVASQTPSQYLASGNASTVVYGNATVAYSQQNGESTTKLYYDKLIDVPSGYTGTANPPTLGNLLVSKGNGSWTISGIPCVGVQTAHLTYRSNMNKVKLTCSSSTVGVSIGALSFTTSTSEWGKTVYTYSCDISFDSSKGLETFVLAFSNQNSGDNIRIDQIRLEVSAVQSGAAPTSYSNGGTFGDE